MSGCVFQVNGRNIEGMRHADVVAFIKKGGDETWLLVVDPESDAHFKKRGVIPTVGHITGTTWLLPDVKTQLLFSPFDALLLSITRRPVDIQRL